MEQQVHRVVTAVILDEQKDPASKLEWTPEAKMAMTKLILSQAETLGTDIEAFAKHAKRSTVQPDDIKLGLRRNPDLVGKFNEFMQGVVAARPAKKSKTDEKSSVDQVEPNNSITIN